MEYILIIGLIVLVLIGALFVFRDSVLGYIDRAGVWLDEASQEPPPPAPPRKAPEKAPAEEKKVMSDDDWAEWLEGKWCASGNNLVVKRISPGVVSLYRVYPDGSVGPTQTVKITSMGNDGFKETLPGDPDWWVNDRKLSENSWKIESRADGLGGGVFTRC